MTTYPNDQGQGPGAIPVYLTSGGTPYAAGSPPPFVPTGQATITAGTSTANVALGSAGASCLVQNTGSVTAYVKLGDNTVTAALTDQPILAGQSFVLATGSATYLAAITGSSTAALLISTGTGTPTLTSAGGTGGGGGGGAVTIADGADGAEGAKADVAVTDPTASGSVVALAKGELLLTGSLTEAPPATDTASSGLNGRLQRIAQRVTSVIALLPTSLGAKTAATSLATTVATDDVTLPLYGPVNETAPATDTASSGQNGRLQRIAQRLTSLIALLPASLGIKNSAGSLSVTSASDAVFPASQSGAWLVGIKGADGANIVALANGLYVLGTKANDGTGVVAGGFHLSMGGSDGTNYRILKTDTGGQATVVPGSSTTGTLANVAASATSVTLLASNAGRRSAYIYNDGTLGIYMKYGSAASTTSFTYLIPPNAGWRVDDTYTGIITGIWASATGNARVTEVTV